MEDFNRIAYVIAGATVGGKIYYSSYNFEENKWEWLPNPFTQADLYNSLENAKFYLEVLKKENKYPIPKINKMWIEMVKTELIQEA